MGRGSICWVDLGEPQGSAPGKNRPVLVIQADPYNASRLNTAVAAVITSNTALSALPGNVIVPAAMVGRGIRLVLDLWSGRPRTLPRA